ncbi:MAG: ketopantoate reductase family protein [Rubellimicrobium sp.]|nr:ketopantoate reductase family protein [Rubellimicrobium sp.]
MTDTVLIWGAGAIGGVLGACWARAGVPVQLVDIDAAHVAACRDDGLSITGPVESFRIKVPAVTPADVSGTFRRVVLAVKAQATEAATRALAPHLAPDGFVLSAQNGLNEHVIAGIVGQNRTMGAFVNFGADWQGPGEILFGNRGAVVIGEAAGPPQDRTREMLDLMQTFEPDAILTDDIWSYLWGKLGYGALLFATALTHETMTENFEDPLRIPAFVGLGREVIAVARAEGVSPRGFNGFDPTAFAPAANDAAARASVAALAEFNRHSAKPRTGVWRDLAVRKRKTEVDPMMTMIAEIGRRHGVPTPLLDRMFALIKDIEDGRREQSPETFAALTEVSQ